MIFGQFISLKRWFIYILALKSFSSLKFEWILARNCSVSVLTKSKLIFISPFVQKPDDRSLADFQKVGLPFKSLAILNLSIAILLHSCKHVFPLMRACLYHWIIDFSQFKISYYITFYSVSKIRLLQIFNSISRFIMLDVVFRVIKFSNPKKINSGCEINWSLQSVSSWKSLRLFLVHKTMREQILLILEFEDSIVKLLWTWRF